MNEKISLIIFSSSTTVDILKKVYLFKRFSIIFFKVEIEIYKNS